MFSLTRKTILSALIALATVPLFAKEEYVTVDVYDFKASLKVPQVVNNTTSQGKRVFKSQSIKGYLLIGYHPDGKVEIGFLDLVNKSFKVNGAYVTYEAIVDTEGEHVWPRLNYIGDNAKESFKTATICWYSEFLPSYAKGGEGGEDNSFLLTFSGKATTSTSLSKGCRLPQTFSGYCAGTQGCGCSAYEHKSPTRKASECGPTCEVDDVAAAFGTWRATFNRKFSRQHCK